jgi:hypothetical protein
MKKKKEKEKEEVKKLRLSKETLRILRTSDAQQVMGGVNSDYEPGSCASWAGCCVA